MVACDGYGEADVYWTASSRWRLQKNTVVSVSHHKETDEFGSAGKPFMHAARPFPAQC